MLRHRVLSAAVFLPLLFVIIWYGPGWLFALIVAFAALLGLLEFYGLGRRAGGQPTTLLGALWVALFLLNAYFEGSYTAPLLTAAVIGSLLWPLFRLDIGGALAGWAWTLGGALYLGWLLSHLILFRGLEQGREWVLFVLLGTFAADTGAYFVGRALGRHPLAPRVSPGKSWEGLVAGLLSGVAGAVVLAWLLDLPLLSSEAVALGILIGVSALLGDLAESLLKRRAGVKDAGRLIPGHGGMLDRLDSIIFTVAVVYYYVEWILG